MPLRTKVSKVREQDVDDAMEKAAKSLDKYYKALGDFRDLSDKIEECEDDMEHFHKQLHRRHYSTTQEKIRLEDKYNLARRHREHLQEQYGRAHGRVDSAKATLDRHRKEYTELDAMFEDQEDKHMAAAFKKLDEEERERRQWFEAKQRRRRPSHSRKAEPGPDQVPRPEYSRHSSRSHDREQRQPLQGQQHPPRSQDQPTRPAPPNRMPTELTITSWRRYVDDCFKDYSSIKEFPHPPIMGRHDDPASWEKDLKALFRQLGEIDLKKESYRWHPDKFSPCEEGKKEKFQVYAREVFVVLNAMAKEK